jgi:hypothetical protein
MISTVSILSLLAISGSAQAAALQSASTIDGLSFSEFNGATERCAMVEMGDSTEEVCREGATSYTLVDRGDSRCGDLVATVDTGRENIYSPVGTFCSDGGTPAVARTAREKAARLIPSAVKVGSEQGKRYAYSATGVRIQTSDGWLEILDAPQCWIDLDSLELLYAEAKRSDSSTDDSVYHEYVKMKGENTNDGTTICHDSGTSCGVVLPQHPH